MTKIILAFPCMGKTYYAKKHPDIALDLESSDFLFDKTGYEHLSSEEFKGIPHRTRKEGGLQDYIKAIDKAVKNGTYRYVFVAQNPEIVKELISIGHDVHYVKPLPVVESEKVFRERAHRRGNNESWIESTIKFLIPSPLAIFDNKELEHVYLHFVPPKDYLSDFLDKALIINSRSMIE